MAVVLVTGCSSGIGLETALAFARHGDTTYATMRNLAKAGPLRARAAHADVAVEILELDVVDDASVAAAVREVESRDGAIDVLVNNAGISTSGSVETTPIDRARAVFETNFWGAVRMMRAVLPAMRERRSGTIVNVSSVSARVPGTSYEGWYAATKHALNALTEAMLLELQPFGVRVVCIEPGFFRTEIGANADAPIDAHDPYAADQAWMKEFFDKSVEAGGGDPARVADAIVRAAHDPNPPTHQLVGDDARQFVDLVAQAGTVEAWLPIAIEIVEGVAGPRPVRPLRA